MEDFMKKIVVISILLCLMLTFIFYKKNEKDLVNMSILDKGEYQAIVWNDKTYVPYCAISNSERGELIGIVNGDKNDQIYQYNNYPIEEWIISFYYSGEMDNSMLMRELSVKEIPDGLHSEYNWNNE
jgi:hypothetical protein